MRTLIRVVGMASVVLVCLWAAMLGSPISAVGQGGTAQAAGALPDTPMTYGALTATFGRDGSFALSGQGWPPFKGKWTALDDTLELNTTGGGKGCEGPGRYTFRQNGVRLMLALQSDTCETRRLMLDGSIWVPAGTPEAKPPRPIVRTPGAARGSLPPPAPPSGSWPSFRGTEASGLAERPEPARPVGRRERRAHPVAHDRARARPFEPRGVGQPPLCDHRDQQRSKGDLSQGALRRWRRLDRSFPPSLSRDGPRQAHGEAALGAHSLRGPAAQQAPHQVHLCQRLAGDRRAHRRGVLRVAGCRGVRHERRAALEGGPRAARPGRLRSSLRRMGARQFAHHLEGPCDPAGRHAGGLVRAGAQRGHRRDRVEDRARRAAVVGHAHRRRDEGGTGARDQRVEVHPRLRSAHGQGAVAARGQLEDHCADSYFDRRSARSSRAGEGPNAPSSSSGRARRET